MKKAELTPMTKTVLKELLAKNKAWQGRTYSLYEAVRGQKTDHIVFILDERTGFGSPVVLPAVELALIDKPVVVRIMQKVLESMIASIKKQGDNLVTEEQDYFKKNPIRAGKKDGKFSYTETVVGNTTINYYTWSQIITQPKIILPGH